MPQLVILRRGDSFELLKEFAENSVGALISDPPYLIDFMGRAWDTATVEDDASGTTVDMQKWHLGWLVEVFRVLKPGGTIKAFSGTRSYHRLAAAMQQAGFLNIRLESWCYGSGFPKGLDLARAIDKELGVEREVVGQKTRSGKCPQPMWWDEGSAVGQLWDVTVPTSPQAKKWDGFNTALKPSWEPFIVGNKPAA
jgi:site-specific DNA-methyltransferase (adenine-specific)